MSQKGTMIVGLDIGTTAVTVVAADVVEEPGKEPRINITGVGTSPSKGLRKGVVINIESTVHAISNAIAQAETMAGREIHSVYASISGSHLQSMNSHGIVGIRDREVSKYDIDKVIEAAKAVAIPLDREVLHVLAQEFIIDDQDGIKEPLGISGVRLEARVHIVTGAVASAQNVVKCANRCGLNVQDIVLGALASGRAVLSAEEQELGVCLVDIGAGTCDLTVFHDGAVKHTSVIPLGGNHISNDIAAGLRTPLAAAESIKCAHGNALSSLVSDVETIDVPSTGGRQPRVVSRLLLATIIEPRVQELFTLIQRDLIKAGCDELLTSGLVLTGGTANLGGMATAAEQVFQLPVRVGAPRGVAGLSELVGGSQYATAVGLVLYGAESTQMSRFAGAGGRVGRVMKRIGNWFTEHF